MTQYVRRVVGEGGTRPTRYSGGHEGESSRSEWGSPCSGRESDVGAAGSSARYSFVIIVVYHWTESNKHGDKHFSPVGMVFWLLLLLIIEMYIVYNDSISSLFAKPLQIGDRAGKVLL